LVDWLDAAGAPTPPKEYWRSELGSPGFGVNAAEIHDLRDDSDSCERRDDSCDLADPGAPPRTTGSRALDAFDFAMNLARADALVPSLGELPVGRLRWNCLSFGEFIGE
jgi:hypothetical protein